MRKVGGSDTHGEQPDPQEQREEWRDVKFYEDHHVVFPEEQGTAWEYSLH